MAFPLSSDPIFGDNVSSNSINFYDASKKKINFLRSKKVKIILLKSFNKKKDFIKLLDIISKKGYSRIFVESGVVCNPFIFTTKIHHLFAN